MKENRILVEQKTGRKFQALIESAPSCPDCLKNILQHGWGLSPFKRHFFDERSMALRTSRARRQKKLLECVAARVED